MKKVVGLALGGLLVVCLLAGTIAGIRAFFKDIEA